MYSFLKLSLEEAYATIFVNYEDVVNVKALCQMLDINLKTGYKILESNELESIRIGREYRIPKASIFKYLNIID